MKTLKEIFPSRYDLLAKYLVAGQMTYLEQMKARSLYHAGIGYWRYYNELIPS